MHKRMNKWLMYGGMLTLISSTIIGTGCSLINIGGQNEVVQLETYSTQEVSEGFNVIAENEYLQLLFDEASTQIAVKDKQVNTIWYSNPQDIEKDAIANKTNKNKLKAQITLLANTPKGDTLEMNSYDYSVDYNQFKFEAIENGIEVTYTLGKQENIYCLPQVISEERLQTKILDLMEEGGDKKAVVGAYKKLDITQIDDDKEKKTLLEQYPQLETEVIYILRDDQPDFRLKQMSDALQNIGYTFEDMAFDEEENGLATKKQSAKFIVPIQYVLDGKELVVTVPMEKVQGTAGYPITNIKVLEYFGAAGIQDEGYMLVPDGAGAIINFNNQKKTMPAYVGKVYGDDYSIEKVEQIGNTEQVYFPVYGMKYKDRAFIGIIEKGDAVGSIQADISGKVNSYNNVYCDFNVTPNQKMRMPAKSGDAIISIYQNRTIEEDLQIRYKFIGKTDVSYVEMAKAYREYLLDKKMLQKKEVDEAPFVVEYIGAIDRQKHILGIPIRGLEPLTTYDQAKEITSQLLDNNISNLYMRYTGMANGGIYHSIPKQIEFERCLGGKKDFKALQAFSEENEITIYPEFDTQYVHDNTLTDGFFSYMDSSRLITKQMSKKSPYNSATYLPDPIKKKSSVASPAMALEISESLGETLEKNDFTGVSVSHLGKEVNSDFNEKETVDRQQSVEVSRKQLNNLKEKNLDIMVSGANQYSLPYAGIITDVPNESNGYNLLDDSIPFMQIVLHGYVPYTSTPLNLARDYKHMLLKNIEVGAGLYYTWSYANSAATKDTDYSKYYATCYEGWIDEAIETYHEINKILGDTYNQEIIGHEQIRENVYKVTYEKGTKVLVNYTEEVVNVEDIQIQPEDYVVIQGGE